MIHQSAEIDDGATVHPSASVWQLAHIRSGARIGEACVIGRGAYIGSGVTVGSRCKIQNYALVYEPAVVGNGVFIGPAAVLTNDRHPRAVNADGSPKAAHDWEAVGVTVGDGASIGAGAVCIAPLIIGRWAMVAAGAVVARDVPDHALVAGAPARQVGWVSKAGIKLQERAGGWLVCVKTGETYRVEQSGLIEER
jgi:acetyltransferase-like isoleucine patch superfamily enzyme